MCSNPFSDPEAITLAPDHLANCMHVCPTAPAPPDTNTVFPLTGPSPNVQYDAVSPGIPKQAPVSKDISSGISTA